MSGSSILRFLPNDQYEAALNANAPSAANPFATQLDTLYGGDGSLVSNREVGLGTFDLNFAISDNFGRFSVAPVGFVASRNIHFKAFNQNPIRFEGADNLAASRVLDIVNAAGDVAIEVFNDSDIAIVPALAVSNRARVMIGTTAPVANSRLTVRASNTSSGVGALSVVDSSQQMLFQVQNNGNIGVVAFGVTTERFNIRGIGSTSATKSLVLEDISGVQYFSVRDNGQVLIGDTLLYDASFNLIVEDRLLVESLAGGAIAEIELRTADQPAFIQINAGGLNSDASVAFAHQGTNEITIGWNEGVQRFRMGEASLDAGIFYEYNPSTNEARHIAPLGVGTGYPASDALLQVNSTVKGFRPPVMTAAQASLITAANGLMLYVTTVDLTFTSVGFWGFENGSWTKL